MEQSHLGRLIPSFISKYSYPGYFRYKFKDTHEIQTVEESHDPLITVP